MHLANKTLVIIGGTSGIGLSAARAFIQAGARVVAIGKGAASVAAARDALGDAARVLEADGTLPSTAADAIALARSAFGGFHGLYHVAGGSGRSRGDGPLHDLSDDGWAYTLDLNLKSVFFSNRAAVRQFLEQGDGGTVLNLGSVLATSPSPRFFATHAYATAKAGLLGLTRAAAAHYAAASIRLNVLAPGLVATPMSARAQADPEILRYIALKQPLDGGRIGLPADLDSAAVFFMSDASKFVTGQVLSVDGGWSVAEPPR